MGILHVCFVIRMSERDVIVWVELTSDVCEGEPALRDGCLHPVGMN
jgi:hypothetical protein